MAIYFDSIHIDKIISSPAKRCVETAKIIASRLSKKISIDKRLEERINFGDISGQSYKNYIQEVRKSVFRRNYVLPNKMTSRKKGQMIEELINEFLDKNLLLVTHQGAISDYLRNVFTLKTIKKHNLKYTKYFSLDSASITLVESVKKPRLIMLNSIKHLKI